MIDCKVCDMDKVTRAVLLEKAEAFMVEYDPGYWKAKEPPPSKKYIQACEVIASLTGLIVHFLETEPEDDQI